MPSYNQESSVRYSMAVIPTVLFMVALGLHTMGEALSLTTEVQEFCNEEIFEPSCGDKEVIVIENAHYGRMAIGKCITRDFGFIGCYADVLGILGSKCSGRQHCNIKTLNENYDVHNPCVKDLSRYLQVKYSCIAVLTGEATSCRQNQPVETTTITGMISSTGMDTTGCGGTLSPWAIKASPGQTINFTLHDFGGDEIGSQSSGCIIYATVKEIPGRSVSVCGGAQRMNHVLMTSSHIAEVVIVNAHSRSNRQFLLEYKVIGCPALEAPVNGWVKRDGKKAVIGCNGSSKTWEAACDGQEWKHQPGDCPKGSTGFIIGTVSIPYTLSVMIVVGAGLLVALCVCCTGFLIVKRQSLRSQRLQMQAGPNKPDPSDPYMSTNYMHFARPNAGPQGPPAVNCLDDFIMQTGEPIHTMNRKQYNTTAPGNGALDTDAREYYQDSLPHQHGRGQETPPPYSPLILDETMHGRPLPPPPEDMLHPQV